MISPKLMKTIQIEITNACPNLCSNCTRFCGWHEKPFFMTESTFRRALGSLQGFSGMVGIMGGEPTLHPEFARFTALLARYVKDQEPKHLIIPEDDLGTFREVYLSDIRAKRGLWTALGSGYRDHFSIINSVYRYQCINDHYNRGMHQALLLPRKELGISDEDWIKLRNKCWIQNQWSACITPKGAFFCEIAGALDMLFEGPGGWKIEPGWWLRRPSEFGDQLEWCEKCSACLAVPSKLASEGVDIISPEMARILGDRAVPKAQGKRYEVWSKVDYEKFILETNAQPNMGCEPYLAETDRRVALDNDILCPKNISVVKYQSGIDLPINLPWKLKTETALCDLDYVIDRVYKNEWILLIGESNPNLPMDLEKSLTGRVYNPEILYIGDGWAFFHGSRIGKAREVFRQGNWVKGKDICYIGAVRPSKEGFTFSLLMPTYNAVATLERAVNSVLLQDYTVGKYSLRILDDGSTDGTYELALKLQREHPDKILEVVRHEANQSALISRLDLIERADGDYTIWVDADDEIKPNFCSFASRILEELQVDILDLPFKCESVGKIKNYGFRDEEYNLLFGKAVYDYFCTAKKNPFNLWSKAIRTDLLKSLEVERVRVDLVDDMVLAFPLYWNANSYLSVNSERLYIYNYGAGHWGDTELTLEKYRQNCNGVKTAYDLNYRFMLEHSPRLDYFDIYRHRSCIPVMATDLGRLSASDRLAGAAYYSKLFSENEL